MKRTIFLSVLMVCAAALAHRFEPSTRQFSERTEQSLMQQIPSTFGDWREVVSNVDPASLTVNTDDRNQQVLSVYSDTLTRTYTDSVGRTVMLALAYGKEQHQEAKIHRPELCYYAQGFSVVAKPSTSIALDDRRIVPANRLLTHSRTRVEPVTYWIRIGSSISTSAWQSRRVILQEGLNGRIPDGILVRVSSVVSTEDAIEPAFDLQQKFLRDLYTSVPNSTKSLLVGAI